MERKTLSVTEAASVLGIGRNTAYELARTGKLPVLRIGGRVLVIREGLDRMLAEANAPAAV